ncbi:glycosyl hydrolase family 18 protein [Patescibacteria group bacterium]
MTKKERILSILVILQTLAILALITTIVYIRFYVRDQLKNNLVNYVTVSEIESTTTSVEKVELSLNVSSSLVWWDQDEGFDSIQEYAKYMYSVSPFWYELDVEGNITNFSGAEDSEIVKYLQDNDIKIIPIISNEFIAEPLASIIADETKKSDHISDILAIANDYDGISMNYENLDEADKNNYTLFVKELAEELHKENKLLSVHLHAKTEEPGTWNGPMGQDWEELGKVCDKLKIMAYDYHWSTSEAGAIAPSSWVEEVIQHALELIPKEKIYLGIPLYGYNWIGEVGQGVTYTEAITLSELNNATVQVDTETTSPYFTYTDSENNDHEVWFENSASTKKKIDLAKQYELGGVDFWRLGGEDNEMWEELE